MAELTELQITAKCVEDHKTIRKHVAYCAALELAHFSPTPPHAMEAVLCGSGPSISTQVNKIRTLKKKGYKVFGIKGAHDWLLEHKINPDFAFAVDPLEKIEKEQFNRKCKAKIVYLIASQCHPKVFDKLVARENTQVVMVHLLTTDLQEWIEEPDSPIYKKYLVGGGSTSGLRCMILAYLMGFRKLHLFGFDSNLQGNLRKITGEINDKETLDLNVAGKKYVCDKAFAAQASEFQKVLDMYKGDILVRAYGQGLIQTLVRERYKQGSKDVTV